MFKALFKDLHTIEVAIMRERLMNAVDNTRKAIEANPEQFDTPIYNANHFLTLCNKIELHLGFDK